MTGRSWKLSQIISLGFIGLILALALFGSVASGGNALMTDPVAYLDAHLAP